MDDKKAVKITITYDDGSTKDLEEGLVLHLTEVPDTDRATVMVDILKLSVMDYFTLVGTALRMGEKMLNA